MTRREHFTIDGFDFGVEPGTAIAEIPDSDGRLHVEVRGNQSVMDQLVAEDAHWAWISHPPHFHIYEVDLIETDGALSSNQDLDPGSGISEVYIYAVAHRTMSPFTVSVADGWVVASGMVHGMADKPLSFELAFQATFVDNSS